MRPGHNSDVKTRVAIRAGVSVLPSSLCQAISCYSGSRWGVSTADMLSPVEAGVCEWYKKVGWRQKLVGWNTRPFYV